MAENYQRTIVFGEEALAHIKAHEVSAMPRNYELWYTYASGYNQSLIAALNQRMRETGKLTPEDLTEIYNHYLAPTRLSEKIDEVSQSLADEIDGIVSNVQTTLTQTSNFKTNLDSARDRLGKAGSVEGLSELVNYLATETKAAILANQKLEDQLVQSRQQVAELREDFELIRTQTLTDELTTLANRRHFEQSLKRMLQDAEYNGETFSLIMTDIDHFKRFNDTYGHQTGDQVLRLVAIAMRQNIKGHDVACRYGGEEFAILLPRTSLHQAAVVAEHARKSVMSKELVKRSTGENLGRITISAGVAEYKRGDTALTLIERADTCLYAAKASGRNCVRSDSEVTTVGRPNANVA